MKGCVMVDLDKIIYECLGKVKATHVLEYDMRGFSPFYDTMILASVESERQATAGVSYIEEYASKAGYTIRGIEGEKTPWVLIDLNDVIVSIFTEEERQRFSLEKIYLEIPCKEIEL
ncbi:MAG: ribosome silencing factor [Anaeroplasmataceae bacterium]|nr:ribosome silencing factor [Anaeroplasmataceae bacterium]